MTEIVIGAEAAQVPQAAAPRANEIIINQQPKQDDKPATPPEKPTEPAQEPQKDGGDPAKEQPGKPDEAKKSDEQDDGEEKPLLLEVGDFDMSALAEEYAETGGLSDESYTELAENGFSRELVDTYIAGVKAQQAAGQEIGEKAQDEIFGVAGGEKEYNDLIAWAETKLTTDEKEAYNKVVATGDVGMIKLAVQGLVGKYEGVYGREPRLIKGGGRASADNNGFKSEYDMKQAMSDPRYGRDPGYTREVEQKVINADFLKGRGRRK